MSTRYNRVRPKCIDSARRILLPDNTTQCELNNTIMTQMTGNITILFSTLKFDDLELLALEWPNKFWSGRLRQRRLTLSDWVSHSIDQSIAISIRSVHCNVQCNVQSVQGRTIDWAPQCSAASNRQFVIVAEMHWITWHLMTSLRAVGM